MTTTLYLMRHANTFDKGDVVLRCGRHTDLPLSLSGRAQAEKLKAVLPNPAAVFVSPLRRTQETMRVAGYTGPLTVCEELNEIDYGPDEGKPETDVVARLGEDVLHAWDTENVMPPEWSPRPDALSAGAKRLLDMWTIEQQGKTIWAVTSGGIARFFAQHATWKMQKPDHWKVSTAAYCRLEYDGDHWAIYEWNVKP